MIQQKYEENINNYLKQIKRLKTRSNGLLLIKLASFALAACFAYFSFYQPNAINLSSMTGCFLAYLLCCFFDARHLHQIQELKAMQKVCEHEIAYLHGDFSAFDNGERYLNPQHEFSFDLDIFGISSLYHRINRTITQCGSDCLAQKLSTIELDKRKIKENQAAITELAALHDWRIHFMAHPYIHSHLDSFATYLQKNRFKNILFRTYLPEVIVFLGVVCFFLCVFGVLPWMFFSFSFLLQIFITILISKISSKTSIDTVQLHKEYAGYLDLLKQLQQQDVQSERLRHIKATLFGEETNSLKALQKLSSILNLFDQRNGVVLYILLNGTILFDVLLIKIFLKWNETYQSHLRTWVDCLAEVDALNSLATYAANHPENKMAEMLEDDSPYIIDAKGVYHPFLNPDKAVPNEFSLNKQNVAIITGANMAGKSTFLRTIGITYLLASNGVPVCASAFRFAQVTLFSSMRTSDNLSKDISYFNAELLRLKQLIAHVKSHSYTLIILDEILKGTNSKDKLEGSVLFLQEISKYPISALIATHDLELSKMEDQQPDVYHNYRFEIELSEDIDEIKYAYKILPGVAQNLNASYLLRNILKSL